MVYVFPDGVYDLTTFKASTLGSIETLGGKKVTGIGTGSYYKNVSIRQPPSCKCHEVFSENLGDFQRYL